MRHFQKFLRQFSASVRPGSSSKSLKSELNFKEANDVVNPFDVIDRNIPGIEQRLRLYEMRRLQEQLKLDQPELENMKRKFISNSKSNDECAFQFETKYYIMADFPGTNCPTENSFDSSVTIVMDIKSLGLSKTKASKFIDSLNIGINDQSFEFTVSDFPLIWQNKARAIEILKAVIDLAKNNDFNKLKNILSAVNNSTGSIKNNRGNPEARLIPEFPQEWLQFNKRME